MIESMTKLVHLSFAVWLACAGGTMVASAWREIRRSGKEENEKSRWKRQARAPVETP